MNEIELAEAIGKAHWRFTPYHGHPHEYILLSKESDVWHELVRRIEEAGYWDNFYSLKVHYYNFMGWKYWQCQEVLNRAPLPGNEIWNAEKWQSALALKAKSVK